MCGCVCKFKYKCVNIYIDIDSGVYDAVNVTRATHSNQALINAFCVDLLYRCVRHYIITVEYNIFTSPVSWFSGLLR